MLTRECYPLVLGPEEIQEILCIGRRQTYELLKNPPFHVVRIGKRRLIKVSRDSFFNWLEGR
ncbi:DNA-binding protein [Paenibacillus flagellatus]|uniref:DNA-binding protein n=1 Tax=Paenibacillus flagellatus TaxID=2211139 RepID=A0A2V5K9D2_9BACL|nr:helix-turn-helix domain-containing protein [Paenibacillus flagellatus]PYI54503.1 DNA-binding protein [Paenibacillus flagellatus]